MTCLAEVGPRTIRITRKGNGEPIRGQGLSQSLLHCSTFNLLPLYPLPRITNVVDFAKNPVRQGRETLPDFARRNIAIEDLWQSPLHLNHSIDLAKRIEKRPIGIKIVSSDKGCLHSNL